MDDNVIKHNALDEMAASVDHEGGVLATTDAKHAPYIDPEYTIKEQQKIIHRVDRRLIGTIGVMYCISQMDRTNLGFAAIAGMTAEMEMTVGFRYVSSRLSEPKENVLETYLLRSQL